MRYHQLTWMFLLGTFLYGLGFFVLGDWTGVSSSSLYSSMSGTHHILPALWGGGASTGAGLAMLAGKYNFKILRVVGATLGTLAWIYAALVYALTGYWLVFFTVALLYLGFWIRFYLKVAFEDKP